MATKKPTFEVTPELFDNPLVMASALFTAMREAGQHEEAGQMVTAVYSTDDPRAQRRFMRGFANLTIKGA